MEPLVRMEHVSVRFPIRGQMPFAKKKCVEAVNDVSIAIQRGKTFGLVGESGCGKSTLANTLLGIQKPSAGHVYIDGQCLDTADRDTFRALRRRMQMVFQDPFSALNPRFTVEKILEEPMRIRGGMTDESIHARVKELIGMVGMSQEDLPRYPTDFSGGQRQRICIARAIALNPELLVCDEPVSALDVSVHAQILNLLMDLQEQLGMTYLFISHNLAVVKDICADVAVMYLGMLMETGPTQAVFANPLHPYTRFLLSAVLDMTVCQMDHPTMLTGDIPSPIDVPAGCAFCGRCPRATEKCKNVRPILREAEPGHFVACHLLDER